MTVLVVPPMCCVYRLNDYANDRNELMLNSLAPECDQYTIKASDAVAGQTTHTLIYKI